MSVINQTCEQIRQLLKNGEWALGERLPSLVQLAEQFGVSRSTMWQVAARLQAEALIHANRGGSIIAGPRGSRQSYQALKSNAWQRTREKLVKDLIAGAFLERRLPPINKLSLQYAVSIDTVKKALHELCLSGMLDREGRGYAQGKRAGRQHEQTVMFISEGNPVHGISLANSRTDQVAVALERECLRLGFTSQFMGFDQTNPNALMTISSAIKETRDEAGYIINLWNIMWDETYHRRWLDLIRMVASRHVPLIIIDQAGNLALPNELLKSDHLRILRIMSVHAGEMVGDVLHRGGHKRIAFLVHGSGFEWVHIRYTGLARYWQRHHAPEENVELFSLNDMNNDYDFVLAQLECSPDDLKTLFKARVTGKELQEFADRMTSPALKRLTSRLPLRTAGNDIQAFSRFLIALAKRKPDPNRFSQLLELFVHLASTDSMYHYLRPLFDDALLHGKATAWVCPNDAIALAALEYLKAHRRKVPEDIAVIGFENWPESRAHQLSSVDFNMVGMVQEAMHLIIDDKARRNKPVITEVDGYVIERRTTRIR